MSSSDERDPWDEETGRWNASEVYPSLAAEWEKMVEEHWHALPRAYHNSMTNMEDFSLDFSLQRFDQLLQLPPLGTKHIVERYRVAQMPLIAAQRILDAQRHHRRGIHHETNLATRTQELHTARCTLEKAKELLPTFPVTEELAQLFPGIHEVPAQIERLDIQLNPHRPTQGSTQ
ncbi:MAG TPA: hypothetical protein VJB60_01955 [Candidatus Peribacterales bacterium]|nr:hypothetical protein [Candidatus Peribacterales bacterium]